MLDENSETVPIEPGRTHYGLIRVASALAHASETLLGLARTEVFKPVMARTARSEYGWRRRRDNLFSDMPRLFGEPAWDILLDLFEREVCNERTTVSSASIAAAVPSTTALRYIARLEQVGLLIRTPDADDRRRVYLELTDAGRARMNEVFGPTVAIPD